MRFKLILVFTKDDRVDAVLRAAREAGATGATVITSARGEGLKAEKTFFGLDLTQQRDVVLLVVEEHLCRSILEAIERPPGSTPSPARASRCRSRSRTRSG